MAYNLGPSVSVCYGDSITIDAGEGFDNYLWSTGSTSNNITLYIFKTFIVFCFIDI